MSQLARQLRIVIPVFNDWASLAILLQRIDQVATGLPCEVTISAVDDGSTLPPDGVAEVARTLTAVRGFEVIRLAVNVGHQRAIAVGLCQSVEDGDFDAVLIMDSDGEDSPESIPAILEQASDGGDFCIVAARRKRSESLEFKMSYLIYKTLFRLATGKTIRFGNFSLISAGYARRLVMIPDLWNNLPAALLRSRLPIKQVYLDRGTRYAGKSHMNLISLIVHGLSAISVYADAIFVRLLLASVGLMLVTGLTIITLLLLRLFVPAHATPGWSTTVSFGMIIILLQVLFTALSSILMLLNSRVQRLFLPFADFKPYIRTREVLIPAGEALLRQPDSDSAAGMILTA